MTARQRAWPRWNAKASSSAGRGIGNLRGRTPKIHFNKLMSYTEADGQPQPHGPAPNILFGQSHRPRAGKPRAPPVSSSDKRHHQDRTSAQRSGRALCTRNLLPLPRAISPIYLSAPLAREFLVSPRWERDYKVRAGLCRRRKLIANQPRGPAELPDLLAIPAARTALLRIRQVIYSTQGKSRDVMRWASTARTAHNLVIRRFPVAPLAVLERARPCLAGVAGSILHNKHRKALTCWWY